MNKIHWIKLLTFKYSISEIIDYFRANFRYWCYYNDDLDIKALLPEHIKEQIDFRINVMMDRECFDSGQCKVCGCSTTQLQMANKACDGHCYPVMVDKDTWESFKYKGVIKERYGNDFYKWENIMYVTHFYPSTKKFIKKTVVTINDIE